MNQQRCVLIGAVRNGAAHLAETFTNMNALAALWKESAIVIAENGSTDSTKSMLETYRQTDTSRIHILNLDAEANGIVARTDRLALVRNRLLEFIHSHSQYSSYDYILMADMDGVLDHFNPASFHSVFTSGVPWDAVFANTVGRYYDVWALRCKAHGISFDCWDLYRHLQIQMGASAVQAKEMAVKNYQIQIPAKKPWIPVESAFGGLGLYRLSKTVGCVYNGTMTECSCKSLIANIAPNTCFPHTCEHVSFHKDMITKHGAKLYIVPSIQVKSQDEHL